MRTLWNPNDPLPSTPDDLAELFTALREQADTAVTDEEMSLGPIDWANLEDPIPSWQRTEVASA